MGQPIVLDANPNPMDVAAGAVASFLHQKKQNQADADQKKIDAEQRAFQNLILKQAADDAHLHAGDEHTLNLDQHQKDIVDQATAAFNLSVQQQLAPYQLQYAALQNKGLAASTEGQQLQNKITGMQAAIQHKFGEAIAKAQLTKEQADAVTSQVTAAFAPAQAAANVNATNAGTLNTQSNTNRTNTLTPIEATSGNLNNVVTGQAIQNNAQTLGENSGFQLPKPTTIEQAEFKVRESLWQTQFKDKTDTPEAAARQPMSPDDFRANVLTEIGAVQDALSAPTKVSGGGFGAGVHPDKTSGPEQAKQLVHQDIMEIRTDPRLSEAQKKMAEQALRSVLGGGILTGGSHAALPFSALKPQSQFR